MKKYILAFLILMLSLPVQAETKNLNQLIYEYASPTMKKQIETDRERQKVFEQQQREREEEAQEKIRMLQAKLVQTDIEFCENLARDWNRAEGKSGKSPQVYYDYFSGKCITPGVPYTPEIIYVAPLSGHW